MAKAGQSEQGRKGSFVRRLDQTPSLRGCLNAPDWWAAAGDLSSAETGIGIGLDKLARECPRANATEVLNESGLPNGWRYAYDCGVVRGFAMEQLPRKSWSRIGAGMAGYGFA
jgi:hypothetical protein